MLSVIQCKDLLDVIFTKYDKTLEVYVDEDFHYINTNVNMYFLCKQDIDMPVMYDKLSTVFDGRVNLYVTNHTLSELLKGKSLLWKNHKWYR